MFLGILMLVTLIPTFLILFFVCYPKDPTQRRLIFGLKNREEYALEPARSRVMEISRRSRKRVLLLMAGFLVIGLLLMLVRNEGIAISFWMIWLFAALILLCLPFGQANGEMKSLKRELGLAGNTGVHVADLQAAGKIHTVNLKLFLIPTVIGLILTLLALVLDLGLIQIKNYIPDWSASTSMVSLFGITAACLGLALYMDRMRNKVISTDSAINTNYNRARKRIWSSINLSMVWLTTIYMILCFCISIFDGKEVVFLIASILYMLLTLAAIVYFFSKMIRLDRRYQADAIPLEDDDDYWVWGMFYYNPNDSHFMVEKRYGTGGTINMATPAGKVFTWVMALLLVGTLLLVTFLGYADSRPIQVSIREQAVVCHQLRDDYTIPVDTITDVKLLDDLPMSMRRTNGTSLHDLEKGTYTVNGKKGCKVFLNPNLEQFIQIDTPETSYYISASTDTETLELYSELTNLTNA